MGKETEESKNVEKSAKVEAKYAVIKEVPIQFGDTIELPDGRTVDQAELLVEIYNKVLRLERSLV